MFSLIYINVEINDKNLNSLEFFLLFITAVQDSGACICSNLSGGGGNLC